MCNIQLVEGYSKSLTQIEYNRYYNNISTLKDLHGLRNLKNLKVKIYGFPVWPYADKLLDIRLGLQDVGLHVLWTGDTGVFCKHEKQE